MERELVEYTVGFLGFGEAAFHIARGLKKEGLSSFIAYDSKLIGDQTASAIRAKAADVEVPLADSAEQVYTSSLFILSLTSASVAQSIAESVIPHLASGQVYVEMNSAAPAVKEAISAIPRKAGVLFCDAAVMSGIPGNGHRVPILLAGDGAAAFRDMFIQYGMNLTDLNAPAGAAAAVKMFRSVVMKGLPQLLLEAMIPACKYGALDALAASLRESLEGKSVEQLANGFFARTILHAQRRGHEMGDVVRTLEDMGCDASMSKATEHKLEDLARSGLGDTIPGDGKMEYREVLKLLLG